ncbi:uncharacterized protein LOC110272304 isoform X2 [Arachis ipaensis]|uniref:uncharacterized protein LOC110272304 isoform X2 n=1 Tax=Arachis ipaensis TaxID=130454 RepID=UPI000A2B610F|nr:uncharacterized protein LOC110272304 isoform X2 [Arachis ipaensis]XP_025655343.1 uncharacterized protein LOC112750735 isoform X2 [Arachis hypogaea]QHO12727.1 uncharacterized protein DS421_15g509370 [Arachis hypogaea]
MGQGLQPGRRRMQRQVWRRLCRRKLLACYNYRHFWAFCNRLPNKLYEKMKVAAPDYSQGTRSHLGRRLSPWMQKIQNRKNCCQNSNCPSPKGESDQNKLKGVKLTY